MSKEAMKLALEALEEPHPGVRTNFTDALKYREKIKQAITALQEALAEQPAQQCKWPTCQSEKYQQALAEQIKRELVGEQPAQQEPVAWVLEWTFNGEERGRRLYDDETHCVFDAENDGGVCRPLVYGDTSPPAQRKPLTRDQVKKLITATGYNTASPQERTDFINGIRHAEAAHSIKENT